MRGGVRLAAKKPVRILEIGPGSGGMNLLYLLKDHPDSSIYALEPSGYNIRELKNRFRELNLKNLFFVKGRIGRISKFPDGFFSMVEVHYVFSDPDFVPWNPEPFPGLFMALPQKELVGGVEKAMVLIDRVLEPGGRLRISDGFKDKGKKYFGLLKEALLTFLEKKGYAISFSTDYFSETGLAWSENRWHQMFIATKPGS